MRRSDAELGRYSGEHYDFAVPEQFFREFGLPEPTANLGIWKPTILDVIFDDRRSYLF